MGYVPVVISIAILTTIWSAQFTPTMGSSIYDGCNVTRGCFGGPSGCVSAMNCKYIVTFNTSSNSSGHFVNLQFNVSGTEQYIAVGFARAQQMAGAAVTQCSISGPGLSYNTPGSNSTNKFQESIPWQGSTSTVDGSLFCEITQSINVTIPQNEYFNLYTENFYLLLAAGPIANNKTGQIGEHNMQPLISTNKVNLSVPAIVELYDSTNSTNSGAAHIQYPIQGLLVILAFSCLLRTQH